jgi:crotonobetainyl-CoA:carnitine CoA-transferase CaiB-like acyl-CoA transferase
VSRTLAGVRVLDLTRMLAGPYGSMLLADMGAEVIKVEDPAEGDPIRAMGPPYVNGESAYFLTINRNKKSVTLDLKRAEGRALFLRLVAVSDVVIDNFRPGVAARLGVDPAACRAARPDVITCSITAFGSDGPYRDLPAFDLILQAMGGGMSVTGEPGRGPVRMGLPIGDLAGGMFAAQAVCGALFHRERTGQGQHIDLGLLDAQASLLTYLAGYHWADGRVPGPLGTGHLSVVPYDSFECADGVGVVVAVFTERFWKPFCDAVGLPELEDRYPRNADRLRAKDELLGALRERFRERPADEWIAVLREGGVPCGPVNTVDRVLRDPQILHRGMVAETDRPHPVAGKYRVLGNPLQVGDEERYEPAPLLGEHNDELFGDVLGVTPERLKELRAAGVI